MVLPLRSAGLSMPESSRTTVCMKPLPPNTATIFTGTPLPRTMIGPSPTMPPIGALPAPTCLATSTPPRADREVDVESGFLEIALALGQLDRREGRQDRRRREQIGDLLERLRAHAGAAIKPAPKRGERGASPPDAQGGVDSHRSALADIAVPLPSARTSVGTRQAVLYSTVSFVCALCSTTVGCGPMSMNCSRCRYVRHARGSGRCPTS